MMRKPSSGVSSVLVMLTSVAAMVSPRLDDLRFSWVRIVGVADVGGENLGEQLLL